LDSSVTSSTSVDLLAYNILIGTRYWCPCCRTAKVITRSQLYSEPDLLQE